MDGERQTRVYETMTRQQCTQVQSWMAIRRNRGAQRTREEENWSAFQCVLVIVLTPSTVFFFRNV